MYDKLWATLFLDVGFRSLYLQGLGEIQVISIILE
jgi:hypothetical protein